MKNAANIFGTIMGLLLIICPAYIMIKEPNTGNTWVGFIFIALGLTCVYACGWRGLIKKKD